MKALVLSGGGPHGSFQAGVLKYLLGDLKTDYDIVSGVSVGAINAAHVAQFKSGEEQEASRKLEDLWLGIDNSKVWKNHCPPYISALWKTGLYSTAPLRKIIEENFNRDRILKSGKLLRIEAVSITTGRVGMLVNGAGDALMSSTGDSPVRATQSSTMTLSEPCFCHGRLLVKGSYSRRDSGVQRIRFSSTLIVWRVWNDRLSYRTAEDRRHLRSRRYTRYAGDERSYYAQPS